MTRHAPSLRIAAALAATVTLAIVTACTPKGETISAQDLLPLHTANKVTIVDVRETEEFTAGHIPGAISRPLSAFDCSKLTAEPGREIILQCRSGRRSAEALERCRVQGRTDVRRHLDGGILDWQAVGGPVVPGAQKD